MHVNLKTDVFLSPLQIGLSNLKTVLLIASKIELLKQNLIVIDFRTFPITAIEY